MMHAEEASPRESRKNRSVSSGMRHGKPPRAPMVRFLACAAMSTNSLIGPLAGLAQRKESPKSTNRNDAGLVQCAVQWYSDFGLGGRPLKDYKQYLHTSVLQTAIADMDSNGEIEEDASLEPKHAFDDQLDRPAPCFTAKTDDDRNCDLSLYFNNGAPTVLVFYAAWCDASDHEARLLEKVTRHTSFWDASQQAACIVIG